MLYGQPGRASALNARDRFREPVMGFRTARAATRRDGSTLAQDRARGQADSSALAEGSRLRIVLSCTLRPFLVWWLRSSSLQDGGRCPQAPGMQRNRGRQPIDGAGEPRRERARRRRSRRRLSPGSPPRLAADRSTLTLTLTVTTGLRCRRGACSAGLRSHKIMGHKRQNVCAVPNQLER